MADDKNYTFINHLPAFTNDLIKAADTVVGMAAAEIERLSKMQVPQKTSALQNSIRHYQINPGRWRISAGDSPYLKYAAYQHRGMRFDGTHVVTKYSNPGSKKNYILDPAKEVYNTTYIKDRLKLIIGAWKAL